MENYFNSIRNIGLKVIPYDNIQFKDKLGEGANGTVYEGLHENKRYAFKRVSNHRVYNKYDRKMYEKDILNELKMCSCLNSKRIMKVYGISYDEINEEIYICMELIKNKGCLFNYLCDEDLNVYQKLKIFLSIVLAVRDLHKSGYCHSDLKPENIVYYFDTKENKKYVKLIDFNCMTKISDGRIKYIPYSYGTYGYCSNEQHKKEISLRSDIYSLGVILLEFVYGGDLWDTDYYNYQKYRKSIIEILESYKNKDYELYSIVKKCLKTTPEKRYSIDELYEKIKIYINDDRTHKKYHSD